MNSEIKNLPEWLDFISHQHSSEIVMGLDRVRSVWERLGKPQAPITITVGGTNGKGSTSAMLEAILNIAGYKTGFYTSPHLLRYNERIRLNRAEASDAALCAAFAAIEKARGDLPFTYFEYSTLAALWLFQREQVDVVILEVGLGGRLDAVNIVDADVAIVTSVALDHQSYLGDTVEKIGWEKAHIYRANKPALFGDNHPPQSLIELSANIGADFQCLGRDFRYAKMENQWQYFGRNINHHALPFPALRGQYQLKNACAALAALEALKDKLPIALSDIKRGLLEVEWPGRLQVIPGRPTVVLDVAHNPAAAAALHEALGSMGFYQNTYAVFGMLKDKDIDGVIKIISSRIDKWFVAGLPNERGSTAAELATKINLNDTGKAVTSFTNIKSAYAAARSEASENDRILVFGSFYTVADVMHVLQST